MLADDSEHHWFYLSWDREGFHLRRQGFVAALKDARDGLRLVVVGALAASIPLSANVGSVHLDRAVKQAAFALHGLTDAMVEVPRRAVVHS